MQIDWDTFSFPFKDEDLLSKALVASLLGLGSFLILPAFLLLGYGYRILQHTLRTGDYMLPAWDDLGGLFMDGLKVMGVVLVYTLPLFLAMGVMFGGMFLVIPASVLVAEQAPGAAAGGIALFYVIMFGSMLIIMPLSFAINFFMWIGVTRMAAEDRFGAALELPAVWELTKRGFKHFVVAFIVWFSAQFAVSFALQILMYTIVLLCLFPFLIGPVAVYGYALQGALYGQAYRLTAEQPSGDALPAPV